MLNRTQLQIVALVLGFILGMAGVGTSGITLDHLTAAMLAGLIIGMAVGTDLTPINRKTVVLAGISGTFGALIGIGFMVFVLISIAFMASVAILVGTMFWASWKARTN